MMDIAWRYRWLEAVPASEGLSDKVKIVAMVIGLTVNVGSGTCNPSYETLARKCACSRDTVMRAVKALEAAGWLIVARSKGRMANGFILRMPDHVPVEIDPDKPNEPAIASPRETANGRTAMQPLQPSQQSQSLATDAVGQQSQTATATVAELCHPNSIEQIPPYIPPTAQPSQVNDAFELLCEIWSDDIGDRGRARTAFHRAVTALTVDPDKIIEAARERRLKRFTGRALPAEVLAQWLRKEGWSASPAPAPSRQSQALPKSESFRVFVEEGSAEWAAWVRYRQANKQLKPPSTTFAAERGRRGWHFPSALPPGASQEVHRG